MTTEEDNLCNHVHQQGKRRRVLADLDIWMLFPSQALL
jgi:hypothetical protein